MVTNLFYFLFWLRWVLVVHPHFLGAARELFSYGMWDLVPRPGIEPGHPALGVHSLTHWTTRKVPTNLYFNKYFYFSNVCISSKS